MGLASLAAGALLGPILGTDTADDTRLPDPSARKNSPSAVCGRREATEEQTKRSPDRFANEFQL